MLQGEKRVIDSNDLITKRIEELAEKMRLPENQGFEPGLRAESVDTLLQEDNDNGEETAKSSVIKADTGAEAGGALAKAREEAELVVNKAKEEAEALKKEALVQAEKEKNAVLEQARAQGYEEGQNKAGAENARLEQEWKNKSRDLEASYQKKLDELEPQFIDTITGIYEHIFHVDLQGYREVLVYLISATMRKIEDNRNFIIHVSKEDYPYVSMEKKQLLSGMSAANSDVEIVEDLTLSKNQCLIETEGGIFDCGVGTQLTELGQKLKLLSYDKQPGKQERA